MFIEQDESFPEDYGVDYCLIHINTDKYPSYISTPDESGEIIHKVSYNAKSHIHAMPILVDPNGINVVPANLYLHSIVSNPDIHSDKTVESHALALLSFYRWLNLELPAHTDPRTGVWVEDKYRLSIYDCTDKVEEGTVYKYRDYLLEYVFTKDENGKIGGSPSTAASYVTKIVAYYSYLHRQRIIEYGENFRPFDLVLKKVRISKKDKQYHMLSHLDPSISRNIYVYTTGLTRPFKNIRKPVDALIRDLHPLRADEKQAFYKYINVKNSTDTKDLMLYLQTETGLRLEEAITFPESVVTSPVSGTVKVQIGKNINGCVTKFEKTRTIEIPSEVMQCLYEYKFSKARINAIKRGLLNHGRLFVKSDGNIYKPNTIEKYIERIRNDFKIQGLDIYFTAHDLRATFATDWLYERHIAGKPFESLMEELAELLGHESIQTTQKYVSYLKNEKIWFEFSQRKNQFAQQVLLEQ